MSSKALKKRLTRDLEVAEARGDEAQVERIRAELAAVAKADEETEAIIAALLASL